MRSALSSASCRAANPMIESIGEDLADRALRKGKATLQEVAGRAIMLVIGVGALLMAIGWGVYAGFLALAQEMNPIHAALIVGGILLTLAMIVVYIIKEPKLKSYKRAKTFRQSILRTS